MVAHCLYRTVFVVGAVLARLVSLLARLVLLLAWLVHFLLGWCHFLLGWCYFLLGWCTSCSVGALLALASGKAERRQVHPLKVHPLRLLLDVPAYC